MAVPYCRLSLFVTISGKCAAHTNDSISSTLGPIHDGANPHSLCVQGTENILGALRHGGVSGGVPIGGRSLPALAQTGALW